MADSIMDKQSSYFSTSHLTSSDGRAGPPQQSSLHRRNLENFEALGGMRRPDLSVKRLPSYRQVGDSLYKMAVDFIGEFPETWQVIEDIRLSLIHI